MLCISLIVVRRPPGKGSTQRSPTCYMLGRFASMQQGTVIEDQQIFGLPIVFVDVAVVGDALIEFVDFCQPLRLSEVEQTPSMVSQVDVGLTG